MGGKRKRVSWSTTKRPSKKAKLEPETDDPVYEVESILGKRINPVNKKEEFLIKWRGWQWKDNTWEPIENLAGCEAAMEAFLVLHKLFTYGSSSNF